MEFKDYKKDELKVGDKLVFMYESSTDGKGHGSPKVDSFKVKIKDSVFKNAISDLINGYENKVKLNDLIKSELKDTWSRKKELKEGSQTKIVKAELKEINRVIKEYKENIKSEVDKLNPSKSPTLFFKNYSDKEINIENAYEVTCYYGGKSLDIRTGSERDFYIVDNGYVKEEEFNKDTMIKL